MSINWRPGQRPWIDPKSIPEELLTTAQVADYFRVSLGTVGGWKRAGLLRPISRRAHKHPKYCRSEIDRFRNPKFTTFVPRPVNKKPKLSSLSFQSQALVVSAMKHGRTRAETLRKSCEQNAAAQTATDEVRRHSLPKLFRPNEAASYFRVNVVSVMRWTRSGKFVAYTLTPNGKPRFSLEQLRSFHHATVFDSNLDMRHNLQSGELPILPADLISGREAARLIGVQPHTLTRWYVEQVFMPDFSTPAWVCWYSEERLRALDREKVLAFVKRGRERYFDYSY